MKRLIAVTVTFIVLNGFLISHGESPPPQQARPHTTSLQQVQSLSRIKPKKPLKIKLKRNSKDDYSWEISGESVDDIINADKRLKKGLGMQ